jgi:hypothetical protein
MISEPAYFQYDLILSNQSIPITAATTHTSTHAVEYERQNFPMMESFVPTPLCASSPSLAVVTVAAGASVTVIVDITGVVLVVVAKGDIVGDFAVGI